MPNMQDIGDPVSIGETDTEPDVGGKSVVATVPPGSRGDALEEDTISAELESAWECSKVSVDLELLNCEDTWTILVVTVFTKTVTKVESLRETVLVLEDVKIGGETCSDDEDADGVARL
jgi:hypothetical protein